MTFLNRHLKRHRALSLCAFMLVCGVSTAQQDLQMSLSALSPMSINPAASGMNDGFKVTSLTRLQWLGWDGAAKTQVATVDAPFFRGFGGSGFALTQDLVGSRSFTSATFSGAAHLPISEEHRVSFGLCGSLRRHGIDFSGLRVHDATDVAFASNFRGWSPNFGAGVIFRAPNFHVGYSIPHLMLDSISEFGTQFERHHYVVSGWTKPLQGGWHLRTNALIKWVKQAPVALDLNAMLEWQDILGLGGSMRWGESLGLLFSTKFRPQTRFVYCIEVPYNKLRHGNVGTHEIGIVWTPGQGDRTVLHPRYF